MRFADCTREETFLSASLWNNEVINAVQHSEFDEAVLGSNAAGNKHGLNLT